VDGHFVTGNLEAMRKSFGRPFHVAHCIREARIRLAQDFGAQLFVD
jgi:hypothetical protein